MWKQEPGYVLTRIQDGIIACTLVGELKTFGRKRFKYTKVNEFTIMARETRMQVRPWRVSVSAMHARGDANPISDQ